PGAVTLNATVSGSGAVTVVFDVAPAGGASWTALGTDTSLPWSLAYDTTKLGDGVYDVRATVTDDLGNSSSDVVTGVRVDNTAPRVTSSSPAEGSTVGSANSISLVTSEPATPVGVTLDGGTTVAPVVSGTNISYGTAVIARVPAPGALPAGWDDGFCTDASGFHVLTDHLSLFALLRDLEPPQAPQNVRGFVGPGGLTIRWLPGSDNSGTYDYVTVFANS